MNETRQELIQRLHPDNEDPSESNGAAVGPVVDEILRLRGRIDRLEEAGFDLADTIRAIEELSIRDTPKYALVKHAIEAAR